MAPVKKNLSENLVSVKSPSDIVGDPRNPPAPYKISKVEEDGVISEVDIVPTIETQNPAGGYLDMVFGPKGKLYALAYNRVDIYVPSSSFPRVYDSSAILPFQNAKRIQIDTKGKIYVSSYSSRYFDFQILEDGSLAYLAAGSGKLKIFGATGGEPVTRKLYFIAPSRSFGQNLLAKLSQYVYPSTDRLGLVVSPQSSEGVMKGIRSNLALAYDFDAVGNLVTYTNTGCQMRFLSSDGEEIASSLEIPYTPVLRVSYSGDVFVIVGGAISALAEKVEVPVEEVTPVVEPTPAEPVEPTPVEPVVELPVPAELPVPMEPVVETPTPTTVEAAAEVPAEAEPVVETSTPTEAVVEIPVPVEVPAPAEPVVETPTSTGDEVAIEE